MNKLERTFKIECAIRIRYELERMQYQGKDYDPTENIDHHVDMIWRHIERELFAGAVQTRPKGELEG